MDIIRIGDRGFGRNEKGEIVECAFVTFRDKVVPFEVRNYGTREQFMEWFKEAECFVGILNANEDEKNLRDLLKGI